MVSIKWMLDIGDVFCLVVLVSHNHMRHGNTNKYIKNIFVKVVAKAERIYLKTN